MTASCVGTASMLAAQPRHDARGDIRIWQVYYCWGYDQDLRLRAAAWIAVIDARKIGIARIRCLPVRNAKRALVRSPLIERNSGSGAEQIGKAQDTGHLCAGVMHNANFVFGTSRHCSVTPGPNFVPSGD